MNTRGKLAGKIAVVTGSSAGIGRASGLLFAEEGATMAAVDCDPDGNAKLVEQIHRAGGLAEALTADVSSAREVEGLGTAEEMAHAALYLVSDDASFVTGSAFQIDGGMSL